MKLNNIPARYRIFSEVPRECRLHELQLMLLHLYIYASSSRIIGFFRCENTVLPVLRVEACQILSNIILELQFYEISL
jgi:hypothetical protein